MKKLFSQAIMEQLESEFKEAYSKAYEMDESGCFDAQGKRKTASYKVNSRYTGRGQFDHHYESYPTRPVGSKTDETMEFKAGTTIYTVPNTTLHIRLLAYKLGIKLVQNPYTDYPVWVSCNGYKGKPIIKVKPVEGMNSEYLPVFEDPLTKHKGFYYVLFRGKLLRIHHKTWSIPHYTDGHLFNICSEFSQPEEGKITQELIDAVSHREAS